MEKYIIHVPNHSKPPTSESSEIWCLIFLVLCCKQIVRWFTRWVSAALGHQTDTWVLKFSAKTRKTKLKSGLAGLGEIKGNQTGWWFCDLDLQEISSVSRDPTIHPQVQAKLKRHLEIVRGTSKAMFKEPKLTATSPYIRCWKPLFPVDVPRTQLSIQSLKFSAGAEMEWDLGLRCYDCYESQKGRTTICFNKKWGCGAPKIYHPSIQQDPGEEYTTYIPGSETLLCPDMANTPTKIISMFKHHFCSKNDWRNTNPTEILPNWSQLKASSLPSNISLTRALRPLGVGHVVVGRL